MQHFEAVKRLIHIESPDAPLHPFCREKGEVSLYFSNYNGKRLPENFSGSLFVGDARPCAPYYRGCVTPLFWICLRNRFETVQEKF